MLGVLRWVRVRLAGRGPYIYPPAGPRPAGVDGPHAFVGPDDSSPAPSHRGGAWGRLLNTHFPASGASPTLLVAQ